MIYIVYVLLATLTVLLSIELATCVDRLDKKSNLSGAFIGGVLLAAVTSLPELFTSLTAVLYLDKPQLVQGNVLGSNIFNLAIFGLIALFFTKRLKKANIARTQISTLWLCIALFICVISALHFSFDISLGFTSVHIMSIVMLGLYMFGTLSMKHDESGDIQEGDVKQSLATILCCFVLYAILLIVVSILLTNVTEKIARTLQMGETVAGAIFLGIATSLPELSSSISLAKLGNFNSAIANVIGSCLFNFTILCFADFLFTGGSIYDYDHQAIVFAGFGILSSIVMVAALRIKHNLTLSKIMGILIMLSYLCSVYFSM